MVLPGLYGLCVGQVGLSVNVIFFFPIVRSYHYYGLAAEKFFRENQFYWTL